ncbi:MAG TPA: IS1595 family transposase [Candidatus Binatia bacterium]|nr:IS1595 family transposase [Candidatus Binatia bacterium]
MPTPNLPPERKYTFKDFERDFPGDEACMAWLVEFLYPHGIHCLGCGEVRPHHQLKGRPKVWTCDYCGTHTHPTAGTIFHKSSTSLKTWFHAIYLMSATRCGISAMQLMRETGVTYKTAWRMFNLIRKMLLEDLRDLHGSVEVDETYVGGKKRGRGYYNLNRGGGLKTAVGGAVERGGRVSAYVMEGRGLWDLTEPVAERVLPESTIFTDEAPQYKRLTKMGKGWEHRRIHHAEKVYVRGDIHTNTIEGFWSLVKRGISGVYHSVSKKHLQGYLDEYSFRYNHRFDDRPMFKALKAQISQEFVPQHFPQKYRPRKGVVSS